MHALQWHLLLLLECDQQEFLCKYKNTCLIDCINLLQFSVKNHIILQQQQQQQFILL